MVRRLPAKLRLVAAGLLLAGVVHNVALAQSPGRPAQIPAKTIIIDLSLLDVTADVAASLEKSVKNAQSLDRLLAEVRAKAIASLQIRSRPDEQASIRIGQRIPVQTAISQGVPQISYENTGLNVEATPWIVGQQIQIKLKVDVSSVARYQTTPGSPAFLQRTLSDVVAVRPGESAVLVSAVQSETLWPSLVPPGALPANGAGAPGQPTGNFAAIVTARILE